MRGLFIVLLALAYAPDRIVAADTASTVPGLSTNTAPLPATVDLRPQFEKLKLTRRCQGGRPTCSVFTVAGAIEFAAARQQPDTPHLSVEFLNWASNQTVGEAADGGFFSDLWKGFVAHGVCAETEMPYAVAFEAKQAPSDTALAAAKARLALGLRFHWIKEWNVNTGLATAEMQAIKHTLTRGWPVCGGFRWPKTPRWEKDVLQMCPADQVFDGHSVLLVGYRDDASQPGGGVFLFRNSGGDGRDGWMPFDYAQAYMNDAAWVDAVAK